ncbi:OmpH family outer membrane protein [Succinispira mobilis]|uniref:OmpH family outer membrane protein n=1 Tax=Succinispira mobilis TaxID=78120 RepID=UPI00035CCE59|nr:OmpH family outer membrane protein [Succinispira mobilis]
MKKFSRLTILLILVIGLLVSGCAGRNNAIGVVDMEKVATSSEKVKSLQTQMQEKIKLAAEELDKDRQALQPEEFNKKKVAKDAELRGLSQKMQDELEQEVQKIMAEIAKEKNLGAVLVKQGVAQGGVDITDEVIKRLK